MAVSVPPLAVTTVNPFSLMTNDKFAAREINVHIREVFLAHLYVFLGGSTHEQVFPVQKLACVRVTSFGTRLIGGKGN